MDEQALAAPLHRVDRSRGHASLERRRTLRAEHDRIVRHRALDARSGERQQLASRVLDLRQLGHRLRKRTPLACRAVAFALRRSRMTNNATAFFSEVLPTHFGKGVEALRKKEGPGAKEALDDVLASKGAIRLVIGGEGE